MKNKKNLACVAHYVSESDLFLLDGYYPEMFEKEPARFKEILWKHGFNVLDHEIEVRECLHRNWRRQEVYGRMFTSCERLDRDWCNTGCMSLEAVIASMDDKSTRQDMVEMATVARFDEVQ